QQMARSPDASPAMPLTRWPAGSQEQRLLKDLQAALTALHVRGQDRHEKEQPYQSIFETAVDGLIIHDSETGRVVQANPAAGAMHGYAREAFIGLDPAAFIHPDSLNLFSESAQAVQPGGVFEALMIHRRQDGSSFHVETRGTAFTFMN